jgi:hypothetical protein
MTLESSTEIAQRCMEPTVSPSQIHEYHQYALRLSDFADWRYVNQFQSFSMQSTNDGTSRYNGRYYERYVNASRNVSATASDIDRESLAIYQRAVSLKENDPNESGYARWLQIAPQQ